MRSKTFIIGIILILLFSSFFPITFCKEIPPINIKYVDGLVANDNIRSPSEFEQATELMITKPTIYHLSIEEEPFFVDIVRAAKEPYDIEKAQNSFEINEFDWWPCFHHDSQNIGYSTSDAPDDNEMLWWYAGEDRFSSSPAVVDGRVYTGCSDSNIYCFNALTGNIIWSYDTNSWWIKSSPAVYNGKVYIGTADKNIYCLDSETGSKIWDKPLVSGTVSSPVIVDNKLFIGSSGHNVYCLDPENGNNIWSYSTGGMVESSPAVYDGKVYVGSWDNKLYCLDAETGDQIWNYITGDNVVSSPSVFNDKIYFGSYDHNIYCLDAETGDEIWIYETGNMISSSPAIAYDKLYIGGLDSKIYCLDIYDGSIVWNFSTRYGNSFSPIVAEGKVYVGCVDSNLYCLDAETGDEIWSYRISGGYDGFGSSAAIADGRIYIGGHDNQFYCFDSTGGNQPPNKPNKPQGKTSGKVENKYTYSTSTDDIDDDLIWYTWNWGDGTYTEWVGPYSTGELCEVSNFWYENGNYNITVFAKDEHGALSEWSDSLTVTMPRSKSIDNINPWIFRFIQRFPILEFLL
jgi:outer membrane protein assembly factor BamB